SLHRVRDRRVPAGLARLHHDPGGPGGPVRPEVHPRGHVLHAPQGRRPHVLGLLLQRHGHRAGDVHSDDGHVHPPAGDELRRGPRARREPRGARGARRGPRARGRGGPDRDRWRLARRGRARRHARSRRPLGAHRGPEGRRRRAGLRGARPRGRGPRRPGPAGPGGSGGRGRGGARRGRGGRPGRRLGPHAGLPDVLLDMQRLPPGQRPGPARGLPAAGGPRRRGLRRRRPRLPGPGRAVRPDGPDPGPGRHVQRRDARLVEPQRRAGRRRPQPRRRRVRRGAGRLRALHRRRRRGPPRRRPLARRRPRGARPARPQLTDKVGAVGDVLYLAWQLEPVLVGGLVAAAVAYYLAVGPLRRYIAPGERYPTGRAVVFGLGLLMLFLNEGSPLHDLAERYLLSAHMVQHLLLSYAVAPVLLAGVPRWLLEAMFAPPRVLPVARVLLNPVVTFFAFSLTGGIYHVPAVYDLTLADTSLQHAVHFVI